MCANDKRRSLKSDRYSLLFSILYTISVYQLVSHRARADGGVGERREVPRGGGGRAGRRWAGRQRDVAETCGRRGAGYLRRYHGA